MSPETAQTTTIALLTIPQVAAMGYGHPNSIRTWIADGKLRATRVAPHGRWGIDPADLEALGPQRPPHVDGSLTSTVAALVASWPRLTESTRQELQGLLIT